MLGAAVLEVVDIVDSGDGDVYGKDAVFFSTEKYTSEVEVLEKDHKQARMRVQL